MRTNTPDPLQGVVSTQHNMLADTQHNMLSGVQDRTPVAEPSETSEPAGAQDNMLVAPLLAEKAAAIHKLVKRAREDIVEIGRHLAEARDQVDHGEWLAWIKAEFDWSDQTARRFIHVYELSRDPKLNTVLNLNLPLGVLYQFAAPKSEAVREEIAKRAEAGEPISPEMVLAALAGRRRSPATDLAEPGNTGPVENDPAAASAEGPVSAPNNAALEDADGAANGLDGTGQTVGHGDGAHDQVEQHDPHGDQVACPAGEAADEPPFLELLDFWKLAAAEEKQEVLTHEGVNGLLNLLKRDPGLLSKLYDHVIGQQVALASPVKASTSSKKLLVSITGTMHWALGQDDPAAGAQALTIIKAKLSASKRDPKDICFCFAKNTRR